MASPSVRCADPFLSSLPILEVYNSCAPDMRLRVREVIEQLVLNNTELILFVMLSHQILNEHSLSAEHNKQIQDKLESWHDDILSSCLNFKRSVYRHISDFKFNLGTVKGCEKLFFRLDKTTETLRNSSIIEDIFKDGKTIRRIFEQLAGIIEPRQDVDTKDHNSTTRTTSNPQTQKTEVKDVKLDLPQKVSEATTAQTVPTTQNEKPVAVVTKQNSIVKTMDTNSLLDSFGPRTPLQPVSQNMQKPPLTEMKMVENQGEDRPVKTYLQRVKSPSTPEAHSLPQEEAPRPAAPVHPESSPSRALFGMSFGPADLRVVSECSKTLQEGVSDKENIPTHNLAKSASKDRKHNWMLDTLLGKNVSAKNTAQKAPKPEYQDVFSLWNTNQNREVQELKESGFASPGLTDWKRGSVAPELAEVHSKSVKDDRVSFTDNFMTEQTLRSFSNQQQTAMNLRLLESRATTPLNEHGQTPTHPAMMYSTNPNVELTLGFEPNFVSNTSEQNKLLKNFLTFSNVQGLDLNLKDSQVLLDMKDTSPEGTGKLEMRIPKENKPPTKFSLAQSKDSSKLYRSEYESDHPMKNSLAKRHSTVGHDEMDFCASETTQHQRHEQFLSHKSDQAYFDKLQKKLETNQKNQPNPLFELIESVDDRTEEQISNKHVGGAEKKSQTAGRDIFQGVSDSRHTSQSVQEQGKSFAPREEHGHKGHWTSEGPLLQDASPNGVKYRHPLQQKDSSDDLNSSKLSQGAYVERNTPSRIKCAPGSVCPLTPVTGVQNKAYTGNKDYSPEAAGDTDDMAQDFRTRPEPSLKFDTKKFLAGKKAEKLHVNMAGLEKIVLSNNGKFALFGGKGLHVLDMRLDKFRIVRNDKQEKIKFSSIKVLKNDNLLISEPGTNDLILLNTRFEEVRRIPGIRGDCFDNEAIRSSQTSNDGDSHYIWFKGGNVVSIVDTETLEYQDVDLIANQSLPISVAVNRAKTKMAVLSIVEDQNLFLNYWEKGKAVVNVPLSACCPKVVASMSIELSVDEQTLFVSGCDKMDINEGRPIITAVSFDAKLEERYSVYLSDPKMRNVFKMKRLPHISEDILLVAGFHSISIVSYNSATCKLQELKTLGGLHDGEIFDFTVFDNVIYSISGKDTYIHKY